jgi:hypothetical protein
MYWRRFRIADLPLDDQDKFEAWLRGQWVIKDALMEQYLTTGRFPANEGAKSDFVNAQIKTERPWEILEVFRIPAIAALLWRNAAKVKELAGWYGNESMGQRVRGMA